MQNEFEAISILWMCQIMRIYLGRCLLLITEIFYGRQTRRYQLEDYVCLGRSFTGFSCALLFFEWCKFSQQASQIY